MKIRTADAIKASIGKTISHIEVSDADVDILFDDGCRLYILDEASYCCETRYMTCDDDATIHAGAKLVSVEEREVGDSEYRPEWEEGYDVHDVAFLVILTTAGALTVATHNEHNGYYGGFGIAAFFHPPLN